MWVIFYSHICIHMHMYTYTHKLLYTYQSTSIRICSVLDFYVLLAAFYIIYAFVYAYIFIASEYL